MAVKPLPSVLPEVQQGYVTATKIYLNKESQVMPEVEETIMQSVNNEEKRMESPCNLHFHANNSSCLNMQMSLELRGSSADHNELRLAD